ncbi:Hypothetical protein AT6N2_L0777 [Agrobacterium tumefaciens]|nr:Hypothetical protein AT6N2_L0777 [Agrobacterium tumefaciens]
MDWLTDNGSCFIAKDTRSLLIDIGLEPCPKPFPATRFTGIARLVSSKPSNRNLIVSVFYGATPPQLPPNFDRASRYKQNAWV